MSGRFAPKPPLSTLTPAATCMEHARLRRSVRHLPSSVDFSLASALYPLVATFQLVCAVTQGKQFAREVSSMETGVNP